MTRRPIPTLFLRLSLFFGSCIATGFVLKAQEGRLRETVLFVVFLPGLLEGLVIGTVLGLLPFPREIAIMAPSSWIARALHRRNHARGREGGSLWHREAEGDERSPGA